MVSHELPGVNLDFEMVKERDQISNIHWIIEKARKLHKNICFCFIDYAKAKLWKIIQERGIPDQLACLLGNLYAGQEATVRTWNWNS